MPGIGDQQVGVEPAAAAQGVVIQPFLDADGEQGGRQGPRGGLGESFRLQDAHHRIMTDDGGHGDQENTQAHGDQGLDAAMAIGMVFVGGTRAMFGGEQHHRVAYQVGQGVYAVGHQGLGVADHPQYDLAQRQQQVDQCPHHGDPAHLTITPVGAGVGGFSHHPPRCAARSRRRARDS